MPFAPDLPLRSAGREKVDGPARVLSVPSGLAKRARMILLAADGYGNEGNK